jgi:hypothetical protein
MPGPRAQPRGIDCGHQSPTCVAHPDPPSRHVPLWPP